MKNFSLEIWVVCVLNALAGMSRTLSGVSDTSSSVNKPKLVVSEGERLARQTARNLEVALRYLWYSRKQIFNSGEQVRGFVDRRLAMLVSLGLLKPGQSLYRTWETEFGQTPVGQIEEQYQGFCDWFCEASGETDQVAVAALVEKWLDGEIHPFADGCGRTSKLLAAYVLLRVGLPPVKHRSREEYYSMINRSDEEWIAYYKSLPPAGELG